MVEAVVVVVVVVCWFVVVNVTSGACSRLAVTCCVMIFHDVACVCVCVCVL